MEGKITWLGEMQSLLVIFVFLSQTAATKYITQVVGGDNRR